MEFSQEIYINGVKRKATPLGMRFYVDTGELPCRPCSQHSLLASSVTHLKDGGAIYTSGNVYSLRPNPY